MIYAILCVTVNAAVVVLGLLGAAMCLIVCVFVHHIDIPPFWNNIIMTRNLRFDTFIGSICK